MPSAFVRGRIQGAALVTPAAASSLAELQQLARLQKLPRSAKLVPLLRELLLWLFGGDGGDDEAPGFTLELVGALATGGLPSLKADGDSDAKKAARLLYLVVSEVVARRTTTLTASTDGGWQQINAAFSAVLEDASGGHAFYAPRRMAALRTLGILIAASSSSAASAPALAERAHKALRPIVFHAQEVLEGPAGGKGKGGKKREQQDWIGVAEGLASMIRRVVLGTGGSFCPPDWLSFLYSAMLTTESCDASRASLAALTELARRRDDLRTEMAIFLTTNKKLGGSSSTESLPDTLQAIHYLRFCAAVAIPASGHMLSASVSEAFVRVLLASVHDKRLRVWLEAVQLLYGGSNSASFSSLMDTTTVGRVLSLALHEQTSAPAVAAILRAIRTVGRWLFLSPATGHLESIGQQPASGPLLEAVLAKAAALQPTTHPSVRLNSLLALLWLAPSPIAIATSADEVWASLEAQVLSGAAHLTDRQLGEVLTQLLERFRTAPTATPANARLAHLLLRLVRALFGAFPTDEMSRAAMRVCEALWAAAAEEQRSRTASTPYSFLSVPGVEQRPVAFFSLSRDVMGSLLATLDDAMTTPGSVAGARTQRVPRRYTGVWHSQGCTGPPSHSEARAVRMRFFRLALRSLARWAEQLPQHEDGLAAVVLLRLQATALYGDAQTRTAALDSLCKLALGSPSLDVKVAAYDFLSSLMMEAKGSSALACFDAEAESVVGGAVAATVAHLEGVLLLERGAAGMPDLETQARLLRIE